MLGIARWLHAYSVSGVIAIPGIPEMADTPSEAFGISPRCADGRERLRTHFCRAVAATEPCYPVLVRRRRSRSHAASISAAVVP